MVYAATFNAMYYYLCKHCLVWDFKSKYLSRNTLRALHIFMATPLMVLLFMANVPVTLRKQLHYLIHWVMASMVFEVMAIKTGVLFYRRGWNYGWSALLYLKMYVYSFLLRKFPVFILVSSIITTLAAFAFFKIPLRKRFLRGPLLFLRKI